MSYVAIGAIFVLAIVQLIDLFCLSFFDRHLFRSKYSSEPTWRNVFLRIKEKR